MSFSTVKENPDFCRSCVTRLEEAIWSLESTAKRGGGSHYSTSEPRYYSARELDLEKRHYLIPNVKRRAEDGCRLCALVLRAFTKEEVASLASWTYSLEDNPLEGQHRQGALLRPYQPTEFTLSFKWSSERNYGLSNATKTKQVIINAIRVERPWYNRSVTYPYSGLSAAPANTFSDGSMKQVMEWIQVCEAEHQCYDPDRSSRFLPTRLIELEDAQKLRLRNSIDLPPMTRYATLSYCWGDVPFHRLLHDNITSLADGISASVLPQVFQDAIVVLERLHIKHVWIDALCIIQDSPTDWNAEAPKMAHVYTNSYLNISATASRNPQEGLFRVRSPYMAEECRFVESKFRDPGPAINIGTGTPNLMEWECVNTSDWVTAIVEAPLNKRAWVYQERALAPRILHFSASELFWECNHTRASETFTDGLPFEYTIPKQKNLLYRYSAPVRATVGRPMGETFVQATSLGKLLKGRFIPKNDNSPLDLWTLIVEDYSSAQLTYATDKLVAISALAETFAHGYEQKHLGPLAISPSFDMSSAPVYLAGLWSHQLFEQLLWRVKSYLPRISYGPDLYVAPSWSWASSFSPIDYKHVRKLRRSAAPTTQLLSATTTPTNTSFGSVTAGSIKVLGPLFKAFVTPTPHPRKYKHYSTLLSVNACRDSFYGAVDYENVVGQEVFCLPLFISPWQKTLDVEIEGLLLMPMSPGIYRRVGIFTNTPMSCEMLFQEIKQAQEGEHFEIGARRNVTLGEFWQDYAWFLGKDEYEGVSVDVFVLEIV